MEYEDYSKVIQTLIQRIQERMPQISQENDLIRPLNNLDKVVQQKYMRDTEDNENLKSEIMRVQNERNRKEEEIQKLNQEYEAKKKFRDEMITQLCSLIIQEQWQHYRIMRKERKVYENQISQIEHSSRQMAEEYSKKITNLDAELDRGRKQNTSIECKRRNKWDQKKQQLDSILLQYNSKMMRKQEELESIQKILEDEERKLTFYKNACESHKETYEILMKEREEYLEEQRQQKLYEIRVRIAQRTIVKFIEKYYPAWKKHKLKAVKKKSKYKFNVPRYNLR